jgi:hypothetical protein
MPSKKVLEFTLTSEECNRILDDQFAEIRAKKIAALDRKDFHVDSLFAITISFGWVVLFSWQDPLFLLMGMTFPLIMAIACQLDETDEIRYRQRRVYGRL